MDIVENNTLFGHSRSFPKNATEDNTCFRRRNLTRKIDEVICFTLLASGSHLNRRFDALEAMRSNGINCWPFNEFEVSKSGEV